MNFVYLVVVLTTGLLISGFFYTYYYKKTIFVPSNQLLVLPINPTHTAFVFDIHKVFMHQNFIDMGLQIACTKYGFIFISLFLRPSFWFTIHKIRLQSHVLEYVIRELEKIYPQLAGFSVFFEKLLLDQKPLYKTVAFIQALKEEGYTLSILSNCALETYNKMVEAYPDIFNLFDAAYLPSKENNYRSKPNPQFFKEGIAELKKSPHLLHKQLIFIDDKKRNILAGLKEQLIGIHFVSVKQLSQDVSFLKLI